MNWQEIAINQSEVIEKLVDLCDNLIGQLAQYKNIENEERLLKGVTKHEDIYSVSNES